MDVHWGSRNRPSGATGVIDTIDRVYYNNNLNKSFQYSFPSLLIDTEVRDLGYTFLGGRDSGVERSLRSNGFLMLLGFVVLAAQLLRTH